MQVVFVVHSFDSLERGGVLKIISDLTNKLVISIDEVVVLSLGDVDSFAFDINKSINFISLNMKKYNTTFYTGVKKLKWFFDTEKLIKPIAMKYKDAVWVTSSPPLTLMLGLIKHKYDLRVVGCDHISTLYRKNNFIQFFRNKLLKKIDVMVALTPQDREYYISHGINSVYIPNGVEIGENNYVNSRKNIVFVGRFHEVKQPLVAMDLFCEFNKLNPGFKLKMFGHGSLENEMHNFIALKECQDFIEIINDEINPDNIYSNALALIMTSKVEGLPMVLLEAISRNIPCLAIDCPYGPANIISESINGFLINGDYSDFESKLNSCKELVKKDFRYSISRFEINNVASEWLELLKTVESKNKV